LRIFDRPPDIHLGSVMVDHIKGNPPEDLPELWFSNVEMNEFCLRIKVFSRSRREIVDDDNMMSFVDICVDDVRGYETRPSRNEDVHIALLF